MPVTVPLPTPILRTLVRHALAPGVEIKDLRVKDGAIVITGTALKMGVCLSFGIELVPRDGPVEDAAHAIEFEVRKLKPLNAGFVLELAVKTLGDGSGVSAEKRILRLDLDTILDQVPVWNKLPEKARRLARVQSCHIPSEGGALRVVFSLA